MTNSELEAIKAKAQRPLTLYENGYLNPTTTSIISLADHCLALVAEVERLTKIVNTTVPGLIAREETLSNLLVHAADNWAEAFVCLGENEVRKECKECDAISTVVDEEKTGGING